MFLLFFSLSLTVHSIKKKLADQVAPAVTLTSYFKMIAWSNQMKLLAHPE